MKELYDTVMLVEVYIIHSGCFVFNLAFHLLSAIFYHAFSLLGGFLTANAQSSLRRAKWKIDAHGTRR